MKATTRIPIPAAIICAALFVTPALAQVNPCFDFADAYTDPTLDGAVQCFATFQGSLYMGGVFSMVDGVPCAGLARWSGTAWEPLPQELFSTARPRVNAMCVWYDETTATEYLVVGGQFTGAGPMADVHNLARWDGSSWSRVGHGLSDQCRALCVGDPDGAGPGPAFLVAGGDFYYGYNYVDESNWLEVPLQYVGMYQDGQWWPLIGTTGGFDGPVFALLELGATAFPLEGIAAGGRFDNTAGLSVTDMKGFAIYRYGSQWEAPWAGSMGHLDPVPTVKALAVYEDAGMPNIAVGGDLELPGQPGNLYYWDGTMTFTPAHGLNGGVSALAVVENFTWDRPVLYVGGSFSEAYSWDPGDIVLADNIVIRDEATALWYNLCPGSGYDDDCPLQGVDLTVRAIHPYASAGGPTDSVLLGGHFSLAGGRPYDNLANWTPADEVVFTQHPANAVVCPGASHDLSAAAAGSGPVTYQWYKKRYSSSIYDPIPGATSSTFTITDFAAEDAGRYRCEATGVCGAVLSNTCLLELGQPADITAGPLLENAPCPGWDVRLRVDYVGDPAPTFRWYHDGLPVTGGTAATLVLEDMSAADEGDYHCVVENPCRTVTSGTITVTMNELPAITSQPTGGTVRIGESVTFTVTATGTDITYRWRKDLAPIPGATGPSYTIASVTGDDSGSYDCRVTNACNYATSDAAVLTVVANQPPTADAQADVDWGLVPLTVAFDGSGSSDPESLPLTYDWDFGDGSPHSSEISPAHEYAAAGVYTAILTVTDDLGATDTASVTVTATDLTVAPLALDFGEVLVGEYADLDFIITNHGDGGHDVDITVDSEQFAVQAGGGLQTIAGGSSLTVTIRFAPTGGRVHSCTVETGSEICRDVVCSGIASYGDVDYDLSTATTAAPEPVLPVQIYSLPGGSGRPLTSAMAYGGDAIDATITVTIRDPEGNPIAGYPAEEIWLETADGGLVGCGDRGPTADAPTDAFGRTTFSLPLTAGGYSIGSVARVVISEEPLVGSDLSLRFVSADIDGSGIVNLGDVPLFVANFYGTFHPRSDFYWDGVINLSDITMLAAALGSACAPAAKEAPAAAADGKSRSPAGGRFALSADPLVPVDALRVRPGELFEVHLLLLDAAAPEGVAAWECRIELPANLRILEWDLAGRALDVAGAPDLVVGLAEPLPLNPVILLGSARCELLDDGPGTVTIGAAGSSSFGGEAPGYVTGGRLVAAAAEREGAGALLVEVDVSPGGENAVPGRLSLHANVPNPFNPLTVIGYDLPEPRRVRLTVFALDGRRVATLVDRTVGAGSHRVAWQGIDDRGRRVPSGVYFYRLEAGAFRETRRMTLLK